MPIRTSSFTRRISENGQALRRAMMSRGADQQPTEAETGLVEERRLLKEERAKRKAQALLPGPSAVERMVRTRRAEPKNQPKASKDPQEAKEVKKPKAGKSRAEKSSQKAAALDAARRSPKKPATK
jgi:hypothetical protein